MYRKLTIALIAVILFGAGSLFATGTWTSSATGSCTYSGITFYPWDAWGTDNGTSGSWNDGTYHGIYTGTQDSTKTYDNGVRSWYHGTWSIYYSGAQITVGTYSLTSFTLNATYTLRTWSGTWSSYLGYNGTMSGSYYDPTPQ